MQEIETAGRIELLQISAEQKQIYAESLDKMIILLKNYDKQAVDTAMRRTHLLTELFELENFANKGTLIYIDSKIKEFDEQFNESNVGMFKAEIYQKAIPIFELKYQLDGQLPEIPIEMQTLDKILNGGSHFSYIPNSK